MNKQLRDVFLQLVRLGIGYTNNADISGSVNWEELKSLADRQGMGAIVFDGLNGLTNDCLKIGEMPQVLRLEWIGEVLQGERLFKHQQAVAVDMAELLHHNAIRTYLLKGNVIAECYPKPEHRVSVDIDCFLQPEKDSFDAFNRGNDLIQAKSIPVNTDFYKNSTFVIAGVKIENHQYLTPFRGNQRLAALEQYLQQLFHTNADAVKALRIGETQLYRPPVMVSALFLIEHAYSHFLHEGLTWRMVLDWAMFRRKHNDEIDWRLLNKQIDDFGFRRFYDSFHHLGLYLLGDFRADDLSANDRLMLEDIWAPLHEPKTVMGWRGKMALARNTWRARWKYRHFSDINWVQALWIQTQGVLFEKQPNLKDYNN